MLERRVFQKIMMRSGQQEQKDNLRFLESVPLLQGIHPIELVKISDFLKRVREIAIKKTDLKNHTVQIKILISYIIAGILFDWYSGGTTRRAR